MQVCSSRALKGKAETSTDETLTIETGTGRTVTVETEINAKVSVEATRTGPGASEEA